MDFYQNQKRKLERPSKTRMKYINRAFGRDGHYMGLEQQQNDIQEDYPGDWRETAVLHEPNK